MTVHQLYRLLALASAGSALLGAAGCAPMPPTSSYAIAPVPPNEARIWFFRELGTYESPAEPFVRLNGTPVGVAQRGGAFYRDVAPGHYTISADSYLADPYQIREVDIAAGQEIYAKVLPMDPWIEGGGAGGRGGGGGAYHKDTFYVWLFPAETARPEIAQSWFYGDGRLTAAAPPPG
jgi:hypothetical protein